MERASPASGPCRHILCNLVSGERPYQTHRCFGECSTSANYRWAAFYARVEQHRLVGIKDLRVNLSFSLPWRFACRPCRELLHYCGVIEDNLAGKIGDQSPANSITHLGSASNERQEKNGKWAWEMPDAGRVNRSRQASS
jgi:hypothetical protein